MTGVPRYDDARNDRDLIGFPLTLYLHLMHDVLSPITFRPVKQEAMAARWHVSDDTIARTLQLLITHCYIERGPVRQGETRTYRLVYERMAQ